MSTKRPLALKPSYLQLKNVHTNLNLEETVRFQSKYNYPIAIQLSTPAGKRYHVSPTNFTLMPNEMSSVTVKYCVTSRDRLDPRGVFHKKTADPRGHRDPCFRVQTFESATGRLVDKFLFSAYISFFEDGKRDYGAMFRNRNGAVQTEVARHPEVFVEDGIEYAEEDDDHDRVDESLTFNNRLSAGGSSRNNMFGRERVDVDVVEALEQEAEREEEESSFHTRMANGENDELSFMAQMLQKSALLSNEDNNTDTDTDTTITSPKSNNTSATRRNSMLSKIKQRRNSHVSSHPHQGSCFASHRGSIHSILGDQRNAIRKSLSPKSLTPKSLTPKKSLLQKTLSPKVSNDNKASRRKPSMFSSLLGRDISISFEDSEDRQDTGLRDRTDSTNSANSTMSNTSVASEVVVDMFSIAMNAANILSTDFHDIFLPLSIAQWVTFYDTEQEAQYYYNPATNESTWDKPDEGATEIRLWKNIWQPMFDLQSQQWFFYNLNTGESCGDLPGDDNNNKYDDEYEYEYGKVVAQNSTTPVTIDSELDAKLKKMAEEEVQKRIDSGKHVANYVEVIDPVSKRTAYYNVSQHSLHSSKPKGWVKMMSNKYSKRRLQSIANTQEEALELIKGAKRGSREETQDSVLKISNIVAPQNTSRRISSIARQSKMKHKRLSQMQHRRLFSQRVSTVHMSGQVIVEKRASVPVE